ncbi:hypothetical protein [Sphingomonas sp. RB1R13]|uniref:hypothetical protein n=1 Tax=Sphingomonas sp. RB1R13 TaxID=3096159 RepID=UPI002FC798CA
MAFDVQHPIPMPDSWKAISAPYLRYELMYRLYEIYNSDESKYIERPWLEQHMSFFLDDMIVYDDNHIVGAVFFDVEELDDFNRLKGQLSNIEYNSIGSLSRSQLIEIKNVAGSLFALMQEHGVPQISLPKHR